MRMRRAPIVLTAVLTATLAACSESPAPLAPDAPSASVQPGQNIIGVQNRHTPDLMRRDGILGTGIRQSADGQSIVVYAVSPAHAAAARIPARLEGFAVDIEVTGRIDAVRATNPKLKARPAPVGFSVGHPSVTAGTIGAKVKDATGNVYILSNNHVIANSNNAKPGDPTLQPGAYDGGTAADQIGTLHDFQVIVMGGAPNTMDAAIARVNGNDLDGRTPADAYGAPGTTVFTGALLNRGVQKFGRTTGHTTGTVVETNVQISVCYVPRGIFMCAQAATFTNQIAISDGSFSAGGDSGSLIVTNDASKNPVGLLFAGSSTRTFANPIQNVLTRFGVTIDASAASSSPPGNENPPPPNGADNTPPTASFTYSCGNTATCSFTDQSTDNIGVTAWAWSGAFTSSLQNPQRTFPAGTHTVTLTVRDAAGNASAAYSREITCGVRGKTLRCS